MATLTTTMTAFTRADSEMPIIRSTEMAQTISTAGRLMMPGIGIPRAVDQTLWQFDAKRME